MGASFSLLSTIVHSRKVTKYGHMPLFFELILLVANGFNKLVDILKDSMYVNTMYRDRVFLYGIPWLKQRT